EALAGVVVHDRAEIERPGPPRAVEDVVRLEIEVVQPGLPMPLGDLSPGSPGIEMEGQDGKRRLRQVRYAVGNRQVANEAQAVEDGRQDGKAEQHHAAGGAVVPGPAKDE